MADLFTIYSIIKVLFVVSQKHYFKVGLSRLRKSAKLKFSSTLFVKIPSFICLVFKIENKLQILFS